MGFWPSWEKNISHPDWSLGKFDIPDSLLDILQGTQSPCCSTMFKGLLLELCPKIHLRETNRIRFEGKEAIDPVHDMPWVMVDHKQVINITEDIGIIMIALPAACSLSHRSGSARHGLYPILCRHLARCTLKAATLGFSP